MRQATKLARLQIDLQPGADVTIEGFGMPFSNRGHPSDDWINKGTPIVADLTVLELLRRRTFVFLVNQHPEPLESDLDEKFLPPAFAYPYGTEHEFNLERYRAMIPPLVVRIPHELFSLLYPESNMANIFPGSSIYAGILFR